MAEQNAYLAHGQSFAYFPNIRLILMLVCTTLIHFYSETFIDIIDIEGHNLFW